jgi:hypothetical protein
MLHTLAGVLTLTFLITPSLAFAGGSDYDGTSGCNGGEIAATLFMVLVGVVLITILSARNPPQK